MTAEIAIINKSAIALAADSAVTLSVGNARKIYRSADKIFELCTKTPIAIMYFNNLEFMEIPLEVVAKDFRNKFGKRDFDTVVDCSNDFLEYLRKFHIHKETSTRHVARIFIQIFTAVDRILSEKIHQYFQKAKPNSKGPDIHAFFTLSVKELIGKYESMPSSKSYAHSPLELVEHHIDAFNMARGRQFSHYPLDDTDNVLLKQLAGLFLQRDVYSEYMTGFVFAGFGAKELFPTMVAVECDGIIANELKVRRTHHIDIDRRSPNSGSESWKSVDIIPFAQTNMAERFLVGIDSDFEKHILSTIENMHRQVASTLAGAIAPRSNAKKSKMRETIDSILETTFNHFKNDTLQSIKQAKRRQIEDMVLFMPKQELAFLAEAMINLTSIKRRVSAEDETVAGPIDVAIISLSESVIWVKRKHYFDAKLNPRYIHRLSGQGGSNSGGGNDEGTYGAGSER